MKLLNKIFGKLLGKIILKRLFKYIDMESKNTTFAGIVMFLGLLFTQVGYLFDADTTTTMDYGVIVAAFGALWAGLKARDNDVTSEKAGAK